MYDSVCGYNARVQALRLRCCLRRQARLRAQCIRGWMLRRAQPRAKRFQAPAACVRARVRGTAG